MQLLTWPNKKEVLVSNLHWQVLDPFANKLLIHDQINQMITEGYRYFLQYKNGADVNMGITSSTAHEALKKYRVYSVAAQIATHPRFRRTTTLALLRIEHTEEPMAYAIGLVDGNVVMDEQLAITDIATHYLKFVGLCESSGRYFVTHGDIAPEGMSLDHPFTLTELVEGGKGKKIKLGTLKNDKKILLALSAAIALVAILLLFWAWDWYELNQKKLEDQFNSALKTPAYLYDTSIKAVLVQDYLLVPTVVEPINDLLRQLPVQVEGWTLSGITCTLAQCQLTWQSTGGTFEDFRRAAPTEWGKLSLGGTGNTPLGDLKTLQHGLKLSLTPHKLPPLTSWPSRDDFVFQMGVQMQKLKGLKWTLQLSPATQQAIPPGLTALQVSDHPNAIYAMPWSVTAVDWSLTRDIFATLGTHFTLDKFSFLIDERLDTVTFTASGMAYVRK